MSWPSVPAGGGGGDQLDADELAAVQGAATPSAANVFATVDDLPGDELTADELAAVQGAATPSAANVFATVDDLPADELTVDELAAIQGAATPSAANVFATVDDLPVDELTADELAAVQGAATPSAANVFATVDDLPAAGDVPVDWTGYPGVLSGPGSFDVADYTDAFTISGAGTALDTIATLGSGAVIHAELTGTYGGLDIEPLPATDFMIVARMATSTLSEMIQVGSYHHVALLSVVDNVTTLVPWYGVGYARQGIAMDGADLSALWNGAAWTSWTSLGKADIAWPAVYDVAISQFSGKLYFWVGYGGSWELIITKARVAIAGLVMLRMHGTAGQTIGADIQKYAPVGVFPASSTPPRLSNDV